MEPKSKKTGWRKLDNTGKIFPVIANEQLSNVFRISATLKETIDSECLQQALEDVLPHVSNFRVKLRRGVFWYYFEENTKVPQVLREATYPCRYIDPHGNRRFLFRVTYFERRINLEVFHALTDGLGAVNFLKELICQYLYRKDGGGGYFQEETRKEKRREYLAAEDSYLKNYRQLKHRHYSSSPAFRLGGNYLPLGTGQVLHGYVPTAQLKAAGKRYGVSITKYLAVCLIWSIWQEYLEGGISEEAIVLNIPINLRAFFGSETMANFFAVTLIGHLFQDPNLNFETLVSIVSRQMDRKIDKDRLEESISYNVSNEKKWYIRIIPLLIKRLGTGLVFRLKDRAHTMTLSNIGPIMLPEPYDGQVERFHLMIGVSRRQPVKCAVCAYKDEVVITFSSVFSDSHLQKRFFKMLKEQQVTVRLEGNELAACRKRDGYPRVRKILVLRKGGEAKANRLVNQVGHTGQFAARGAIDYLAGERSIKDELSRRFHV